MFLNLAPSSYLEDGNNTILPYIVSVESATQTWFGKDVRQPLRQNGRHVLAFRQPLIPQGECRSLSSGGGARCDILSPR